MTTQVLPNCDVVGFSDGDTIRVDARPAMRCTGAAYAAAYSLFRRGALTLTVDAGLVVAVALTER